MGCVPWIVIWIDLLQSLLFVKKKNLTWKLCSIHVFLLKEHYSVWGEMTSETLVPNVCPTHSDIAEICIYNPPRWNRNFENACKSEFPFKCLWHLWCTPEMWNYNINTPVTRIQCQLLSQLRWLKVFYLGCNNSINFSTILWARLF